MPTRRSTLFGLLGLPAVLVAMPLWATQAGAEGKGNKGGAGKENGKGGGDKGNGKGEGESGASTGGATGNAEPSAAGSREMSAVIRHRTGIEERILHGRYIMKDNRGRIIVNRRASRADGARIEALRRR
jgi:hypothetical protein